MSLTESFPAAEVKRGKKKKRFSSSPYFMYVRKKREIFSCPETLGLLYDMNIAFLNFEKYYGLVNATETLPPLLFPPLIFNKCWKGY